MCFCKSKHIKVPLVCANETLSTHFASCFNEKDFSLYLIFLRTLSVTARLCKYLFYPKKIIILLRAYFILACRWVEVIKNNNTLLKRFHTQKNNFTYNYIITIFNNNIFYKSFTNKFYTNKCWSQHICFFFFFSNLLFEYYLHIFEGKPLIMFFTANP